MKWSQLKIPVDYIRLVLFVLFPLLSSFLFKKANILYYFPQEGAHTASIKELNMVQVSVTSHDINKVKVDSSAVHLGCNVFGFICSALLDFI